MKKLKKVVAMLLVGALVLGNVGAIPVSAEETTTSGVVYKEDFNNAQKPTLADYKITTGGTIVSGGTGEAYGKMTDENGNGCIYLRGHGASGSGTTNTIIIPFDDTAYTNEIVWAEFDIKYMATGRPYQLTITPDSNAAVATIKTTVEMDVKSSGDECY